jgi:hypothetical protein
VRFESGYLAWAKSVVRVVAGVMITGHQKGQSRHCCASAPFWRIIVGTGMFNGSGTGKFASLTFVPRPILAVPLHRWRKRVVIPELRRWQLLLEARLRAHFWTHGACGIGVFVAFSWLGRIGRAPGGSCLRGGIGSRIDSVWECSEIITLGVRKTTCRAPEFLGKDS